MNEILFHFLLVLDLSSISFIIFPGAGLSLSFIFYFVRQEKIMPGLDSCARRLFPSSFLSSFLSGTLFYPGRHQSLSLSLFSFSFFYSRAREKTGTERRTHYPHGALTYNTGSISFKPRALIKVFFSGKDLSFAYTWHSI